MSMTLLDGPTPAQETAPTQTPVAPPLDERIPGRTLAIFAHPDDAEFTCGGSIARWTGAGAEIAYVVCTDGSKGGDELLDLDDEALCALREAEQRAAAASLGVAEIFSLRHADGELDETRGLRRELAGLIRHWRPARVLAWDPWRPYQLHPDHRAAGLAAVEAALFAGNPRIYPELEAHGLRVHRVDEIYLFSTARPDVYVDIGATFERKLAAVAAHYSQAVSPLDTAEALRACNGSYGRKCGCEYAEAFKVLRPFCDT